MDVLIGADPEVFVTKQGSPFSAFGLIPGNKKAPHKVKDGAVQVDGMALEFNISPANTVTKFVHNLQSVFATLEAMLPADCKIDIVPSVEFDWDHIKAQPNEALELGCDPDMNAYTQSVNPKPNNETNLRTAAGHVHIGWTGNDSDINDAHTNAAFTLTRQLDFYLALPSLYIDKDVRRRSMYGQAGCCRIKPYGVEYRVLSNFWLKSPAYMEWVFNSTMKAIADLLDGKDMYQETGINPSDIINNSDMVKLETFIKDYPEQWARVIIPK